MRFVKGFFKVVGILLALLVVVGLGFYLSDPPYWKRVFTAPMSEVWRVDWYEPQEKVPGELRDDLPSAPADTITAAAIAEAQQYADETHSVALLIWHRGALRHEQYGQGFDATTLTNPQSAHKSVVGLVVGAAIADGYIKSLDQPAADFLPEWTDEARKRIRIRDLLTMSSGLEVISGLNPAGKAMKLNLGDDLASIVLNVPSVLPPGEKFEYSNVNSQLLGIILARATGKRYAQYLSDRLWSELGAGDAWVWLDHEGGLPRTFCCLFTTARAWLRVGLLIKDHGRIGDRQVIPEDWIQASTTPSAANANYGFQLWMGSPPPGGRRYNSKTSFVAKHSEPFLAEDIVFLDGFGGQRVYVVPSQDLVIVRTGKSDLEWDDARLPNAILRGIVPAGVQP